MAGLVPAIHVLLPDPEGLIRRSPESAPLLDAVKDRKTRDAGHAPILHRRTVNPVLRDFCSLTGDYCVNQVEENCG
jgi:hypothetical protein